MTRVLWNGPNGKPILYGVLPTDKAHKLAMRLRALGLTITLVPVNA